MRCMSFSVLFISYTQVWINIIKELSQDFDMILSKLKVRINMNIVG